MASPVRMNEKAYAIQGEVRQDVADIGEDEGETCCRQHSDRRTIQQKHDLMIILAVADLDAHVFQPGPALGQDC